MHIAEKILDEIEYPLEKKYTVNVSYNDWKLFKVPLTDENGVIDKLNSMSGRANQ